MTGLLYLGIAVVCWIPFAVLIAVQMREDFGSLDSVEYLGSVVIAFFASLLWPLVLIALAVTRIVRRSIEAMESTDRNAR